MKRQDIAVGATYTAKIGGNLTSVRIVRDRGTVRKYGIGPSREGHDGWDAVNLTTNRTVHIRSAAKLRRKVSDATF